MHVKNVKLLLNSVKAEEFKRAVSVTVYPVFQYCGLGDYVTTLERT